MNFDRITAHFRRRPNNVSIACTEPDPVNEFPDSGNGELFAYFKENSKIANAGVDRTWVKDGYSIQAHPDLAPILFSLVTENGVKKGYAFGRPVMANLKGLVFAWAGGTHDIWLRLSQNRLADARQEGNGVDRTYGNDWIRFGVGNRLGSTSDWKEVLTRWANIAYQDNSGRS